jgi:hypothetical protein
LRLGGAAIVVCATLASCSVSPSTSVIVSPSPSQTLAADLRTHLDLLLGEHVMIVAKQAAAATNHAVDYDQYASLLAANTSDLGVVFASAFGDTAAGELAGSWNTQNGYLVDYTIGAVTHDDVKTKAALLTLTNEFVTTFAQRLAGASGLDVARLEDSLKAEALAEQALIDDYVGGASSKFYADLHAAYALAPPFGDTVARQIAQKYPDKFPGDPSHADVDRRVALNDLMQEHAYLATLATDAIAKGRTAESAAATAALATNAAALAPLFGASFPTLWAQRTSGLLAYAKGNTGASTALTVDFVRDFATLAHVDRSPVSRQLMATLKVIGDQRATSSKDVAGDDRAAATAMQPIADAAT